MIANKGFHGRRWLSSAPLSIQKHWGKREFQFSAPSPAPSKKDQIRGCEAFRPLPFIGRQQPWHGRGLHKKCVNWRPGKVDSLFPRFQHPQHPRRKPIGKSCRDLQTSALTRQRSKSCRDFTNLGPSSTALTAKLRILCGNSSCLLYDFLFILEGQRLPAAVGEIDDQVIIPAYHARKKKCLYSFCLKCAGQVH